jgi:hypothetical protein
MAEQLTDPVAALRRQVLADRFEVVDQPLGWRCRACLATVKTAASVDPPTDRDIARLGESAADHAMYCGRCDD